MQWHVLINGGIGGVRTDIAIVLVIASLNQPGTSSLLIRMNKLNRAEELVKKDHDNTRKARSSFLM